MKRGMKSNLPVLALLSFLGGLYGQSLVWAGSFQQAYDAALANDASYQAARADLASTQQGVPLARAGLLPSVSFSMSDSKVDGTRTIENPLGTAVTSPLDYRAPSQSLNIRAPLYNREASQKLAIAQTQVNYAQAVFATRKLELLDRLATAYLQRLQAGQALQAANAQLAAARSQRDLAQRRLQLGEGTRPDVLDAEAALDSARVQVTEAQNQITVAALSLRHITGGTVADLPDRVVERAADKAIGRQVFDAGCQQEPPLRKEQEAATAGDRLAQLLNQAEASNPALVARRLGVELAQAAVARNGAGHYPRLDFVASASNSRNDSLSTLNQSVEQRSWGLQLSVPLYSGGAVSASVNQALADEDKARAELVAEQQTVALELTKLFYTMANGCARIDARQKTVAAGRLALEGAQKGFTTGFNTQTDVVQAQGKLAQAVNDWVQTIHEYVLARVRLAAKAGTDLDAVVGELHQSLQ